MNVDRVGFSAVAIESEDAGPLVVALDEVAVLRRRRAEPHEWELLMNGTGTFVHLSDEQGKALHEALITYLEEEE